VLPVGVSTRILVTSNDVIHCFAVPSLAIKSDAIPGRLNATGFIINRPSSFYGQCSELCGVLHGFMPIGIHAVSIPEYIDFINTQE
jgi:heme/copper-type cytochrome/quinol oxidase subunit 2